MSHARLLSAPPTRHARHIRLGAVIVALAAITAAITAAAPAFANPSTVDPYAPFDLVQPELSGELHKQCLELNTQIRTSIVKFQQMQTAGKLNGVNPKEITRMSSSIRLLVDLAQDLKKLGEPAGEDWERRAVEHERVGDGILGTYRTTQKGSAALRAVRMNLPRLTAQRDREAKAIENHIGKEEWSKAEQRWRTVQFQTFADTFIMDRQEQLKFYMPYVLQGSRIKTPLEQQLRRSSYEALTKKIEAEDAANKKFAQLVNRLPEANGKLPDASGQPLQGPALAAHVVETWRVRRAGCLRMLSLLWLRMDVAQQADESVFKIVHTSYTSINDLAVKGLAALIVADAKTPRDAAGFRKDYDGYLAALAPVAAIGEQLPTKALADALRQFAGQESTLAQAAGSYRRATTELMNWRERVAARRSQAAVARFPDVVATVRGALTPPFLVQGSDIQLTGYAPHLVQQVSVLKSKTLSAQQLAGLPGTGARPSISVPARRVYTRFPAVGAEVQTQLARLRADLQIGESVPPLTLAAAAAHWSAAQGWWMSGGGSVEQVYVESLAGRTATLPAVAAAMAPLPSLPKYQAGQLAPAQTLVRVDLKPAWVRHRYFFAEWEDGSGGATAP